MDCKSKRNIVKRLATGDRVEVCKCADKRVPHYGKVVEHECASCPLRAEFTEGTCPQKPPMLPLYQLPLLGGALIYPPGPTPPPAEGFSATDDPLVQKREWPACPYLQFANCLDIHGALIINARCGGTGERVSFPACKACWDKLNYKAFSKPPNLMVKAAHYGKALVKWIWGGRPTRTEAEVTKLFEICKKCDWFESDSCKGCGCPIAPESKPIRNKLMMSTEHCPRGLW